MRIAAVGHALPKNYYEQDELIAVLRAHWAERYHNVARIEAVHKNALVGGRHLALRMDQYLGLDSFTATNDTFIRCAVDLGGEALERGIEGAGLGLRHIDHLFFVSVTGVATPSIDARLVNRLGLRPDIKRTPIFGLGCVAGAAGVARAADYLRGHPSEVAAVLSVELCSLTLQRDDLSMPNIVASGLFGDGAAAAVLVGDERASEGPEVLATRSVFYPDTEHVMGWRIADTGFRVVLSADVPRVVEDHIGHDVDAFLSSQGLAREDIESYVCHPGGPRVLEAVQTALGLERDALEVTWRSLERIGNVSSASVLMVLEDTMAERRPRPGSLGLLMAMGPGFCSELVLLRW
jgi:alkylresorcinol/alkylpyrone synthase